MGQNRCTTNHIRERKCGHKDRKNADKDSFSCNKERNSLKTRKVEQICSTFTFISQFTLFTAFDKRQNGAETGKMRSMHFVGHFGHVDNFVDDGINGETADGMNAKFAGNVFAVGLYGVDTDEKAVGYLFVG